MKQQERIRECKAYYTNPLCKKYEKEKQSAGSKSPIVIICYGIWCFPIIMIFVFGYWFFKSEILGESVPFPDVFTLIFWGIVNLVAVVVLGAIPILVKEHTKESKNIDIKYEKLGLKIKPIENLYKYCPEMNECGKWCCGVTGQQLNMNEVTWCKENCRNCRKLQDAVFRDLFDD